MDCVEVCPVDCFYEGENFLVINPDECIDCGVCEPECPVDAIKPDTEDEPDGKWLRGQPRVFRDLAEHHGQGRRRRPTPTPSSARPDKFEKYFSRQARRRGLGPSRA